MTIDHQAAEAVSLAARHGLKLREESVALCSAGLDFLVCFARDLDGANWVLRMPRRPDVLAKMTYEAAMLELVGSYLAPIEVPRWHVRSDTLIAYPRLAGHPGLTIDAASGGQVLWHFDQKSPVFSRSLGEAVARLHAVPVEVARAAGAKVLAPEQVRSEHRQNIARVRAEFGLAETLAAEWQAWLDDDSFWPPFSALIHGDLYAAHTLLDQQGAVTGIIDWTEASVADPTTDFIFQLMGSGDESYHVMVAAYQKAGGRVWPRMLDHCRKLLSLVPVRYALYALTTKDPAHLAEARAQLGA